MVRTIASHSHQNKAAPAACAREPQTQLREDDAFSPFLQVVLQVVMTREMPSSRRAMEPDAAA
jgi:hypothetical protein